ncbi:MAG: hypothetical protein NC393_06350 [Clostridium sp.]|nr:hypothetical protein [Clostridium sp.]
MKKGNYIFRILIVSASLIAIFSAIFVPELLLDKKSKHALSQVMEAPDSYYLTSQTATARNASSKLSALDKIRLICGVWDSSMTQCDIAEGFLTMDDAVSLAREQMELYYQAGLYPASLYSDYNNWYSFDCNLYKYTDNTFQTYTSYLWEITFTKFDTSTYHTLLMSENGIILAADTNMSFDNYADISLKESAYQDICTQTLNYAVHLEPAANKSSLPYYMYPQLDLSSTTILHAYDIHLDTSSTQQAALAIYQYKKPQGYGFCFTAQ